MSFVDMILIALIQGVTELLPVSSSGHLILLDQLLSTPIDQEKIIFVHFASTTAILIYYFPKLIAVLKKESILNGLRNGFLSTVFVAVIGVVLGDLLETRLYNPTFVAVNLILWGVVMVLIELRYPTKKQLAQNDFDLSRPTLKQALIVGIAHVLALFPGTSRSGITSIAGYTSGLTKKDAFDYSFMIGIPVLIGSFIVGMAKSDSPASILNGENLITLALTFLFSLVSLKLISVLSKGKIFLFAGVYRIALGILVAILLI